MNSPSSTILFHNFQMRGKNKNFIFFCGVLAYSCIEPNNDKINPDAYSTANVLCDLNS